LIVEKEVPAQDDRIVIVLTNHIPVKISLAEWPVIAEAKAARGLFSNTHEWRLTVRQNADGRALVYAVYSFYQVDGESYTSYGGDLLPPPSNLSAAVRSLLPPPSDLPMAIRTVGQWMETQPHEKDDAAQWATLIHECIANIPPQEL
jgi:hypothetical protein